MVYEATNRISKMFEMILYNVILKPDFTLYCFWTSSWVLSRSKTNLMLNQREWKNEGLFLQCLQIGAHRVVKDNIIIYSHTCWFYRFKQNCIRECRTVLCRQLIKTLLNFSVLNFLQVFMQARSQSESNFPLRFQNFSGSSIVWFT